MVMTAAQCLMLARSAARAERTETLKETKTLAKREYTFGVVVLCFSFPSCVTLVASGVYRLVVSVCSVFVHRVLVLYGVS